MGGAGLKYNSMLISNVNSSDPRRESKPAVSVIISVFCVWDLGLCRESPELSDAEWLVHVAGSCGFSSAGQGGQYKAAG